ncbi:hypothetical protein HanIR_Chr13g0654241 [Helianthus annuus]|nr:hypothetical protein HanIR_Chr13g0654241 [Helianthus annuus]
MNIFVHVVIPFLDLFFVGMSIQMSLDDLRLRSITGAQRKGVVILKGRGVNNLAL